MKKEKLWKRTINIYIYWEKQITFQYAVKYFSRGWLQTQSWIVDNATNKFTRVENTSNLYVKVSYFLMHMF